MKAQPITVGVFDNYPLMYTDKSDNVSGIIPEIFNHIAKKNQWQVRYNYGSFIQCRQWLSDGEIDLMPECYNNQVDRKRFLLNDEALISTWATIYAGNNIDFTTFLDLEGKHVAIDSNSFFVSNPRMGLYDMLEELGISCKVVLVGDQQKVLDMVEQGDVEVGVVDRIYGDINKRHYNVVATPVVFSPYRVLMDFSPNFNQVLSVRSVLDKDLRVLEEDNNSIYHQTLDNYLDTTDSEALPLWAWVVLSIFVISIIQLSLYVSLLRREVNKRTKGLREALDEIHEREKLLSLIYNNTKDFIGLMEVRGENSYTIKKLPDWLIGNVLEKFPEYHSFQLLDMELSAFYGKILNIDETEINRRYDQIKQVISTRKPVYFEETMSSVIREGIAESVMIPIINKAGVSHILYVSQDITRQRALQAAIVENEERMRLAVQNVPVMLDAFDEEGKLVVWNSKCEEVTGYRAEEMIGNTKAYEILYPDKNYRERLMESWKAPRDNYEDEVEITCKDGSKRIISWIHRANNYPIPGWADWGIGIDITEKKEAEQALIRSQQQLSSVMDNLPGMAWRLKVDKDFTVIFVSEGSRELLEISPEEFLDKGYKPRDFILKEYQKLVRDETLKCLEERKSSELVIPLNVNGKIKWVLDRFRPVQLENGQVVLDGLLIDISDKLESEQRLQLAIEGARQGMWDWNIKENILDLNQYAMDMLNTNNSSIKDAKKNFFDRLHPDDIASTQKALNDHMHGEVDYYENEYRLKTTNGDWRWIQTRGRVVQRNVKGEPLRMMGTHIDIDARKRVELALKDNEQRLQLAIEGARQGTWDWNAELDTLEFNDYMAEMLGYQKNEMINTTVFFYNLLHPEDQKVSLEKLMSHLKRETEFFEQEYRLKMKSGKYKWIMTRGKVVKRDKQGKAQRAIGIHIDIDTRKKTELALAENERMLSNLMSNLPGMVYQCHNNKKWSMTFVSQGALELTGYSSKELETDAVSYGDIIIPSDREKVWKEVQKAVNEHVSYTLIYRIKTKHHENRWVWEQGSPIKGTDLLEGFIADITDRIEAQEKLVSTVIETEDKERKRIAKELHDSLGQKLTTASLNLNSLKNDLTNESKGIKKLLTGLTSLNSAIKDSRDIAHNLMPRSIEHFGYVPAVQSMIAEIDSVSNIKFDFYDNLKGDRLDEKTAVHLYRITQEAINNILKYSKATTVTIQLMKYENDLVLTIEDDGTGFDVAATMEGEDNFGLRNMRNRVTSISGSFHLDSSPDSGTIITVELPIKLIYHEH
ncbi:PAS domain-containing protein [Fulvivirga sp. M361]|uniref:PAS domain-containing protein n=1 Tax=Fulvivirga sp. M361 TaxID=2594266 RepID=UPI00162A38A6|nr:PAS domain-containing protein [Fulvivirga sp. M361]